MQHESVHAHGIAGFSAGGWLGARLTDRRDYMTADEWVSGARYRLVMPQLGITPGMRCACCGTVVD